MSDSTLLGFTREYIKCRLNHPKIHEAPWPAAVLRVFPALAADDNWTEADLARLPISDLTAAAPAAESVAGETWQFQIFHKKSMTLLLCFSETVLLCRLTY